MQESQYPSVLVVFQKIGTVQDKKKVVPNSPTLSSSSCLIYCSLFPPASSFPLLFLLILLTEEEVECVYYNTNRSKLSKCFNLPLQTNNLTVICMKNCGTKEFLSRVLSLPLRYWNSSRIILYCCRQTNSGISILIKRQDTALHLATAVSTSIIVLVTAVDILHPSL